MENRFWLKTIITLAFCAIAFYGFSIFRDRYYPSPITSLNKATEIHWKTHFLFSDPVIVTFDSGTKEFKQLLDSLCHALIQESENVELSGAAPDFIWLSSDEGECLDHYYLCDNILWSKDRKQTWNNANSLAQLLGHWKNMRFPLRNEESIVVDAIFEAREILWEDTSGEIAHRITSFPCSSQRFNKILNAILKDIRDGGYERGDLKGVTNLKNENQSLGELVFISSNGDEVVRYIPFNKGLVQITKHIKTWKLESELFQVLKDFEFDTFIGSSKNTLLP